VDNQLVIEGRRGFVGDKSGRIKTIPRDHLFHLAEPGRDFCQAPGGYDLPRA
jgi:hypothetical protein